MLNKLIPSLFVILLLATLPSLAQETRFGFLGPGSPAENPRYFSEFDSLGVDFDRPHIGPFIWERVESTKGTYDWSSIDAWVEQSQNAGVRIIATIWPFAEWDQEYWRDQADWEISEGFEDELPLSRYMPHDTTSYKTWIQAMVERYDGDGVDDMPELSVPIKHWEILNEPETSTWEGINFFKGDAADYLEVLRITYNSILSADSEATIFHGGSTGAEEKYWRDLFNMGATDYYHKSNTHAITPPLEVTDLRAQVWSNLISDFGVQDFWITEVELAQQGSASYTEEEHANKLVKNYVRAFNAGAERIFYAHLMMDSNGPEDFKEAALILITFKDGSEPEVRYKKSYYAMKTMVSMIDKFTDITQLTDGQYELTVAGEKVWILWGDEMISDALPEEILVTSLDGSQTSMNTADLSLSESPVFVKSNIATSIAEKADIPTDFSVSAYPNPFNPTTNIYIDLPTSGSVSINLYDITGKKIKTITKGHYSEGTHTYPLNAENLGSGIYFYSVNFENRITTKKITLIK